MPQVVASFQLSTFTSPTDGDSPISATTVKGNDNTIRGSYNSHDADPGIHLQSSTLAARPAAASVGRKWITNDGFRIYYDDGSAWQEIQYLSLAAGGTVAGATTFSSTVAVTGAVTLSSTLHMGGTTAKLNVVAATGEVFRADASGGAFRVVADQAGVMLGGLTQVSAALASTSQFTDTSLLNIVNTNTTNNNWATISFTDGGASAAAIQTRFTDHTNDYGELHLVTRGASGLATRVTIGETGAVTLSSTLAVTGAVTLSSSLRMANTQWVTARNAADNATLNLLRLDGSNRTEIDLQEALLVLTQPLTNAAAGALVGYLRCTFDGAEYRIPYHAAS